MSRILRISGKRRVPYLRMRKCAVRASSIKIGRGPQAANADKTGCPNALERSGREAPGRGAVRIIFLVFHIVGAGVVRAAGCEYVPNGLESGVLDQLNLVRADPPGYAFRLGRSGTSLQGQGTKTVKQHVFVHPGRGRGRRRSRSSSVRTPCEVRDHVRNRFCAQII